MKDFDAHPPKLRRCYRVIYKDGSYILWDLKLRAAYSINEVAAEIASLCDGRHGRTDILKRTIEKYDVDEKTASIDIGRFLKFLDVNEMIE